MVKGRVTEEWAAVFPLTLRGAGGQEITLEITLDTGFDDYLTLPLSVITTLGFPLLTQARGVLADGSPIASDYYGATILWNNEPRKLPVIASENKPLGGMLLIRGCEVRFVAEPNQPLFIQFPAPNEETENTAQI